MKKFSPDYLPGVAPDGLGQLPSSSFYIGQQVVILPSPRNGKDKITGLSGVIRSGLVRNMNAKSQYIGHEVEVFGVRDKVHPSGYSCIPLDRIGRDPNDDSFVTEGGDVCLELGMDDSVFFAGDPKKKAARNRTAAFSRVMAWFRSL